MSRNRQKSVERQLMEKGLLVEAGFAGLRALVIAKNAPELQVQEMRLAFFAGAHHVFNSIITALDNGDEVTEADLRIMNNLSDELESFRSEWESRVKTPRRKQ